MIFGNINKDDEFHFYPEAIQKGLAFCKRSDLEILEVGTYEIEGRDIYAMVQEITTQPIEERKCESHEDYIDIQFLYAGEELMGAAVLDDSLDVKADMRPEKDVIFYEKPLYESFLKLTPGSFAIFFPTDCHRPGCCVSEPTACKKVVVKVKYNLVK